MLINIKERKSRLAVPKNLELHILKKPFDLGGFSEVAYTNYVSGHTHPISTNLCSLMLIWFNPYNIDYFYIDQLNTPASECPLALLKLHYM